MPCEAKYFVVGVFVGAVSMLCLVQLDRHEAPNPALVALQRNAEERARGPLEWGHERKKLPGDCERCGHQAFKRMIDYATIEEKCSVCKHVKISRVP